MDHGTRTKSGIKRARARGVRRGTNGSKLAQHSRCAADEFAEELRPLILELMLARHRGPVKLARELNRLGISTRGQGSGTRQLCASRTKRMFVQNHALNDI